MNNEEKIINGFIKYPTFTKNISKRYLLKEAFKLNQLFCLEILEGVYIYGSVLNPNVINDEFEWYSGSVVLAIYTH